VSQGSPQVTVTGAGKIGVSGPLTFATARAVCAAGIACFVQDGARELTVDCATVAGADSAGLAVLVEWRRWARQQGRRLRYVNLPAQISAIARLSEVTEVLADAAA
jgi:phospholipid transport system transporter-binding protein